MTYKCPYTHECRARALKELETMPDLLVLAQARTHCIETDPGRALRCAKRLGLTETAMPSFGAYVQERRRAHQMPQATLAEQAGISVQTVRDLELNKLGHGILSPSLIQRIAVALSESSEYLMSLTRGNISSSSSRQGLSFARTTPEESQEERK